MRFGLAVAAALAFGGSLAAKADKVSAPVEGSGGGFSGNGVLTAQSNDSGSYTIADISGDYVTGLIGPSQFNGNDNFLFPSSTPSLDGHGFAFNAAEGDTSYAVDIFSSGSGYLAKILDSDGVSFSIPVTFTLGPATAVSSAQNLLHAAVAGDVRSFSFSYGMTNAVQAAATPEPTTFALLGTGFLGLAGVVRRSRRS